MNIERKQYRWANAINWSRGVTRVWIIGSVCWMVHTLMGWLSWYRVNNELAARYNVEATPMTDPGNIAMLLGMMILPPLVVIFALRIVLPFVLRILRWLLAGFVMDETR
jgi:hypothetical protein